MNCLIVFPRKKVLANCKTNAHKHTICTGQCVGLSPLTVHLNVSKSDHLRLFYLIQQTDCIIARHVSSLIQFKVYFNWIYEATYKQFSSKLHYCGIIGLNGLNFSVEVPTGEAWGHQRSDKPLFHPIVFVFYKPVNQGSLQEFPAHWIYRAVYGNYSGKKMISENINEIQTPHICIKNKAPETIFILHTACLMFLTINNM